MAGRVVTEHGRGGTRASGGGSTGGLHFHVSPRRGLSMEDIGGLSYAGAW